jgi:hypothetical protein
MNVVYAGAYTPEQFRGYENAYKKRVLPPKDQQHKSQLKGSSGSGFALQVGGVTHEASQHFFPILNECHFIAGTCRVAGLALRTC